MEPEKEESIKGSCHSYGRSCCCGKALFALILLLLGGVIGYLVGKCSYKSNCPTTMSACPMTQTQEKSPSK